MLDQILADARRRADRARGRADEFRAAARSARPVRSFAGALRGDSPAVIAEIKRRSPSRGSLAPGLDAAARAKRYEAAGAAAVSVLTDPDHFDGSLTDLSDVSAGIALPVLRKDFIFDPAQVWESRAAGADAVLLIVAVLGAGALSGLLEEAVAARMEALVEVHTADEAESALDAGATVIGVNNRDLTTFVTDLGVAAELASSVQRPGVVTVAESGVSDRAGASLMWELGYNAILVGEALVTAADPEHLLQSLAAP
jgi:indole-3-glycerol phosphate synthase